MNPEMGDTPARRSEQLPRLAALLRTLRWGALATLDESGRPHASMVACAIEPGLTSGLLHLSRLAAHTRHLETRPTVSLALSEPDDLERDPQTLARLTLVGTVARIAPEAADYAAARAHYLAKLPDSEMLFGFGDFGLFRFSIDELRLVGGFGQAFTYRPDDLARASSAYSSTHT